MKSTLAGFLPIIARPTSKPPSSMPDPTLLNPTGPDPTAPEALAMMLRVVTGKLKRRLREQAAQDGFNLSQLSVLSRLERAGPATISALARAEGMRTQSMGPHI
ncbi:MarR family winged helix-turn-helix transcriptional regulator, partial [Nguyenibacter vanlangensis]|nr:hypothetical protein [Nguyenibacter vanlangensis]